MSITEGMERACNCGLTVSLADDGENLRVLPSKLLTPELREQLKANKPEIVEVLRLERLWEMPAHDPHYEEMA